MTKDFYKPERKDLLNSSAYQFYKNYGDVFFCVDNQTFYHFDGMIYRKITEIEFLGLFTQRVPDVEALNIRKRKEIIENYKVISRRSILEINNSETLTFLNGFLLVKDRTFVPHSKDNITTVLIPYEYNKDALCPLWIKTLNEIFLGNHHKIDCVQEFFGYCLTKEVKYEKAMLFIGDGANGKSLILNILSDIVGMDNTSVLSLKNFKDASRLGSLENKLVNISSEMQKGAESFEDEFKKIVSGEMLEVNPKFIIPYKIKPFCKLIFAANELPHIDDKSIGFYRRLLVINFEREFKEEEQDKMLRARLQDELAGILNWALLGLDRLNERNMFNIYADMKRIIDDIRAVNNPVHLFCSDCVKVDYTKTILKRDLYGSYVKWCVSNGYKACGANKFGGEFYKLYKEHTNKMTREPEGQRRFIWQNITLLSTAPHTEENIGWQE